MGNMSKGGQKIITKTRAVPRPNHYIEALLGELAPWAFDEERVLAHKGHWRTNVFGVDLHHSLDLEIGTGNGLHFAHQAKLRGDRAIVGLELKYKPLIQTVRRALREGCTNARVARYNARQIRDLFMPGELNDVYIHFPDPWEKLRQSKHRLIQAEFLRDLFELQRPGSILELKTDSRSYFDWMLGVAKESSYVIKKCSFDLLNTELEAPRFITHFERIFLRQEVPIHYLKLQRP